jgi:hypothetical protein
VDTDDSNITALPALGGTHGDGKLRKDPKEKERSRSRNRLAAQQYLTKENKKAEKLERECIVM